MKTGRDSELTGKAIVLGILLSVILSAANAYLGLFAGMTVSASIPAAVISMGLLTALTRAGVFRGHTIRENNSTRAISRRHARSWVSAKRRAKSNPILGSTHIISISTPIWSPKLLPWLKARFMRIQTKLSREIGPVM